MNNTRFVTRMALAYLPALSGTVARPERWYVSLQQPRLNPPKWVFGPVWTALYASMGLAQVQFETDVPLEEQHLGQCCYALQLVLNAAWPILFFKAKSPRWALVNILALWLALLATVVAFARHSRRAALILMPYLAWVSFATYLNLEIVRLNPEA